MSQPRTPDDLQLATRHEVGERVRRMREARGWSQEQLAERVGVDRRTIGSWERAVTPPDLDHLTALARGLEVQLVYLFWV